MRLALLWPHGAGHAVPPGPALAKPGSALLRYSLLASRQRAADPLEAALWDAAELHGVPGCTIGPSWHSLRDYPLRAGRPMLVRAWDHPGGIILAAKGAPEAILPLCTLGAADRRRALEQAAALAAEGMRVLAVARAAVATASTSAAGAPGAASAALPEDPASISYELMGLVALADPLRPDIPAAIRACQEAGIRIVMVTGDHPATAAAIARQAGMPAGAVLTGHDLRRPGDLVERLRAVNVCARIEPRQKLDIVRALQGAGEVVAMTGDGVNDAPALKAAHVGVAMGVRGTDVAREAAELTLLDDRFSSLVTAIAGGRRIFANMRRSMTYVAAIHVPIAGMALLPPLLGWPAVLYPAHIVFLEMMIDPACALAFENERGAPDLMRRPPRPVDEALFGRGPLVGALLQGVSSSVLLALIYLLGLRLLPEAQARALVFAALVLCNVALLAVNLGDGGKGPALGNRVFWVIAASALLLLGAVLYLPALAALFYFHPPPARYLLGVPMLAALLGLGIGTLRHWRVRAGSGAA